MRVTFNNSRSGKDGVHRAMHNDRDFESATDEHINREKSAGNTYWHCYGETDPALSFEGVEARFYAEKIAPALEKKNERYRRQRHAERCKSLDEYRRMARHCPEETILGIGKAGDSADPALLAEVAREFVEWQREAFPRVVPLNYAVHVDEVGAPHMHLRQAWIADTPDGLDINQEKALAQMGIERPQPSKKVSRYNNAKMSYTAACRAKLQEIARSHGLEIETEPREASRSGLTQVEYRRRQEEEAAEAAKAAAREAEDVAAQAEARRDAALAEVGEIQRGVDQVRGLRGEYVASSLFGGEAHYKNSVRDQRELIKLAESAAGTAVRERKLINERDDERAKRYRAEAETDRLRRKVKKAERYLALSPTQQAEVDEHIIARYGDDKATASAAKIRDSSRGADTKKPSGKRGGR